MAKRKSSSSSGGRRSVSKPSTSAKKVKSAPSTSSDRDGFGRFLPVDVSPSEAAAKAEAADLNRLVKFADVVDIVTNGNQVEAIRAKLLWQGNPRVSLRLKKTPNSQVIGKRSISHRLGTGSVGTVAPVDIDRGQTTA